MHTLTASVSLPCSFGRKRATSFDGRRATRRRQQGAVGTGRARAPVPPLADYEVNLFVFIPFLLCTYYRCACFNSLRLMSSSSSSSSYSPSFYLLARHVYDLARGPPRPPLETIDGYASIHICSLFVTHVLTASFSLPCSFGRKRATSFRGKRVAPPAARRRGDGRAGRPCAAQPATMR